MRPDDRCGSKARITAPQHCCPLHPSMDKIGTTGAQQRLHLLDSLLHRTARLASLNLVPQLDKSGRARPQAECADLPLLSGVRLHRVLDGRRVSRLRRCRHRRLRRPGLPGADDRVWEECRHPWVTLPPDTPPKRVAKQVTQHLASGHASRSHRLRSIPLCVLLLAEGTPGQVLLPDQGGIA